MPHNGRGYGVGFLTIENNEMNITKIANRIANLHYPDIPKTRGDKMFRRQRVIELQKLVESELKNCSIPNVVRQSEQLVCDKKCEWTRYSKDGTWYDGCIKCGKEVVN